MNTTTNRVVFLTRARNTICDCLRLGSTDGINSETSSYCVQRSVTHWLLVLEHMLSHFGAIAELVAYPKPNLYTNTNQLTIT
jgi:hypothetical protein